MGMLMSDYERLLYMYRFQLELVHISIDKNRSIRTQFQIIKVFVLAT